MPVDKFFLRRIHQHHAADLRREHAGEDPDQRAAKRVPHQNIGRRHVRISKCGVEFAGNLSRIPRFGAGRGESNARPVIGDRRRESAHFRLDSSPFLQRNPTRGVSSRFEQHRGFSVTRNQRSKLMSSRIRVIERKASGISPKEFAEKGDKNLEAIVIAPDIDPHNVPDCTCDCYQNLFHRFYAIRSIIAANLHG